MKKIFSLLFMTVLTVAQLAHATTNPVVPTLDSWDKPVAPFVSTVSGGRLRGFKSNLGLNGIPGNVGTISNAYTCDVTAANGEFVVFTTDVTNPLSVSETTSADCLTTTAAGVIVTAPGSAMATVAASRVDVAWGGVVSVKVVPLAVTKMDLLGSSGTAGKLTKTTTVGAWKMQALETKTTTTADPLIRARFIPQ